METATLGRWEGETEGIKHQKNGYALPSERGGEGKALLI